MKKSIRYYSAILVLVAGVFLQLQKDAYAQEEDILDLIPYGVLGSSRNFRSPQTFRCKEVKWLPLDCGDGSGGFVDNFYVIFIDADETPANSPLQLFSVIPVDASLCRADSIQNIIVGRSDLPLDLQNSLTIPVGKQAVFHRVRVINGNHSLRISVDQYCVNPESPQ